MGLDQGRSVDVIVSQDMEGKGSLVRLVAVLEDPEGHVSHT